MIVQILLAMGYMFIGIIVDSICKEDWQKPSLLTILFWPILLLMMIIFGLIFIAMKIGETIKKLIFGGDL